VPETAPQPAVFISYARADRPQVAPLAAALMARGCNVWWDGMMEGGAAFAKTIEDRLEGAQAVVVVWSEASIASDWVRDEAGFGRDRKRLVPVSFDGTEPPLGFRQYHSLDLAGWKGDHDAGLVNELLRAISSVASGEALERSVPAARLARRAISRRTALIAGGAAVATAGGLGWWKFAGGSGQANSIAVMPFKNLSGDPGQAFFSDGLAEEIRTTLSRNGALRIAAPTSTAEFGSQPDDPRKIGSKLGVSYLLEGSVRRAGDTARIAAELIDTSSGFSQWSQSFDRQVTDIFAVQTEIANVVAEALAIRVTPLKEAEGGTRNVGAFEAYLKGTAAFRSDRSEASDREAMARFAEAVQLDPKFALARARLAYVMIVVANSDASPQEARGLYQQAIDHAKQAAAAAPHLAQAQLALGFATAYGTRNLNAARTAYDKAYDLGGGDVSVAIPYALFSTYLGRKDVASAAALRAATLDPLNAATFRIVGLTHYYARDYDAALPLFERSLKMQADLRNSHGYIGNIAFFRGKFAEAKAAYAQEPQDLIAKPGLAIVELKLGNVAAAESALAQLVDKLGDNSAFQQMQVHAQWGDIEAALAAMRRAQAANDSGLLIAKVDPLLDPLRGNAEFSRLLNGMGLS